MTASSLLFRHITLQVCLLRFSPFLTMEEQVVVREISLAQRRDSQSSVTGRQLRLLLAALETIYPDASKGKAVRVSLVPCRLNPHPLTLLLLSHHNFSRILSVPHQHPYPTHPSRTAARRHILHVTYIYQHLATSREDHGGYKMAMSPRTSLLRVCTLAAA